jgi:hypothetical protein
VSPEPDRVVVETAKTPLQAQLIVSILHAAGIPAYVGGTLLQDEFAISQAAMGLQATRIEVPRECLEAAREILDEARRAGDVFSDEDDPECH